MTQATEVRPEIELKQRRSVTDIVGELDQEAPKFTGLVLAVFLADKARLISAADNYRQVKLNDAITDGGEPVGMIGYTLEKRRVRFYSRLLEEYAGQAQASDLLECLLVKFMNSLSDSLGSTHAERAAWLN